MIDNGSNDKWMFVLGAPRSGTTLMAYLAGLHERCECLFETHFPMDIFHMFFPGDEVMALVNGKMPLRVDVTESAPDLLLGGGRNRQSRIMGLIGHGSRFLKGDSFLLHSDSRSKCVALTRACCSALRSVCQSNSTLMFGDKSPEYCFWWGLLREIFPECKLIFIKRDREANASSMIRCGFNDGGVLFDMPLALAEVDRYNRRLEDMRECQVHQVQLEELEADPASGILAMIDYLELDPSEYPIRKGISIVEKGSLNRSISS